MDNKEKSSEDILSSIGLNGQESRVYLALLRLKESKTGELCSAVNIASSNIYKILESLIKKGLVSYRVQNNIKIFMPAPPESLNELFLEKQKRLEEERKEMNTFVNNLKKQEQKKDSLSNYKYYEGIVGVKSLWYELNSSLSSLPKGTVTRMYNGKREAYENIIGFFQEHHKTRIKLKVPQRVFFPIEDKETGEKRKRQMSEVKYLELKNDAEWGVIGDLFWIQYITGKVPRAFLIKDKKFAEAFTQVFDQLWEKTKD